MAPTCQSILVLTCVIAFSHETVSEGTTDSHSQHEAFVINPLVSNRQNRMEQMRNLERAASTSPRPQHHVQPRKHHSQVRAARSKDSLKAAGDSRMNQPEQLGPLTGLKMTQHSRGLHGVNKTATDGMVAVHQRVIFEKQTKMSDRDVRIQRRHDVLGPVVVTPVLTTTLPNREDDIIDEMEEDEAVQATSQPNSDISTTHAHSSTITAQNLISATPFVTTTLPELSSTVTSNTASTTTSLSTAYTSTTRPLTTIFTTPVSTSALPSSTIQSTSTPVATLPTSTTRRQVPTIRYTTESPRTVSPSVSPTIAPSCPREFGRDSGDDESGDGLAEDGCKTEAPSLLPTSLPSFTQPTVVPTQAEPTQSPSEMPSTSNPTSMPTAAPTAVPTCPDPYDTGSGEYDDVSGEFDGSGEYDDVSGEFDGSGVYENIGCRTSTPTTSPTGLPTISTPTDTPTTSTPSFQPTELPSVHPSLHPTSLPTSYPTAVPSIQPTELPSVQPSLYPTSLPTSYPTAVPSIQPTELPSVQPSLYPTSLPTSFPTAVPSKQPTELPSVQPSLYPTSLPTSFPTAVPSKQPSQQPSIPPSTSPTFLPTYNPSAFPSLSPSVFPTSAPTNLPSSTPTPAPTSAPTSFPTYIPTTDDPTRFPTLSPTASEPTFSPSDTPTKVPSKAPSSSIPTMLPTAAPSKSPSLTTLVPTNSPTALSNSPSFSPTAPSQAPSCDYSGEDDSGSGDNDDCNPTELPTVQPSFGSIQPSKGPTTSPTMLQSIEPSSIPTMLPSMPTFAPSSFPTFGWEVPVGIVYDADYNILFPDGNTTDFQNQILDTTISIIGESTDVTIIIAEGSVVVSLQFKDELYQNMMLYAVCTSIELFNTFTNGIALNAAVAAATKCPTSVPTASFPTPAPTVGIGVIADDDTLATGVIAAIAIAILVVLACVTVLLIQSKRKKNKDQNNVQNLERKSVVQIYEEPIDQQKARRIAFPEEEREVAEYVDRHVLVNELFDSATAQQQAETPTQELAGDGTTADIAIPGPGTRSGTERRAWTSDGTPQPQSTARTTGPSSEPLSPRAISSMMDGLLAQAAMLTPPGAVDNERYSAAAMKNGDNHVVSELRQKLEANRKARKDVSDAIDEAIVINHSVLDRSSWKSADGDDEAIQAGWDFAAPKAISGSAKRRKQTKNKLQRAGIIIGGAVESATTTIENNEVFSRHKMRTRAPIPTSLFEPQNKIILDLDGDEPSSSNSRSLSNHDSSTYIDLDDI